MLPVAYIVSFVVAPLTGIIWLLWTEGVLKWHLQRIKDRHKRAPPLPKSASGNGSAAGWIESIVGMIGPRAHIFAYEGFKRTIPEGHPWIALGRFPSKSPSGYGYAVADIDLAKEILTAPHSQSVKSIMYKDVEGITCGLANIFTANGQRWKHARKGIAPAFSSNHIKRMVKVCSHHLEKWIETTLDPCAEAGKSFNLGKEMVGLTLSIIAESAFEYDMSREEQVLFTTNLETAAECFVIINPLHKRFPWLFPAVWKARRAAKTIQQIAYRIMDNYKQKHPNYKEKSNNHVYEDDTIISRIMNNHHYESDDERASDIAIFLAAGHDTTAYSIAWTLFETIRFHPPELAKFRNKTKDLPPEEWRQVEELQYIIKEGMRLQPVLAMGTVRDVGKEIVYQNEKAEKVVLPKDSIYFIMLYPMFRNPAYYDEPDKFVPSRWENPKREEVHVPFSIGARNCIGQSLANAELHTVLAVLLAKYDFEIESEGHPEYLTTLKPVNTMLIPKKLS